MDIITTIDSEIQDIVHDYLLEQTEKYDAHHSSAIVMEVQTGDIKAISNFGLTENGKYYEKLIKEKKIFIINCIYLKSLKERNRESFIRHCMDCIAIF